MVLKTGLERGVKQEEILAMMMLNLQLSTINTKMILLWNTDRRPMMENLANKVNKFRYGS